MRISVGFSTSDWLVSRIIRWFNRAAVSHAFLLLDEIQGLPPLVLEAEWCGWKLSTRQALTRGSTRIVALVTPVVPLEDAVCGALAWEGERYNYVGLLGMAWVAVGRWFGKKWRNPLRSSTSLYCSEAIVYVLREAKYPGVEELDPQSVSPEDLAEFLGAKGLQ